MSTSPTAEPDSETLGGLSFKGLFPICASAGDPPRANPSLLHRTLTERLLLADHDDDEQLPVLRAPAASRPAAPETFRMDSCETTSENTRDGSSDFDEDEGDGFDDYEEEEEACIVRVARSCSADVGGDVHAPAAKAAAVAALHSLPASPFLGRHNGIISAISDAPRAPTPLPDEEFLSRAESRAAALRPTQVAGALLPTVAGAGRGPFPCVAPQTVAELLDGTRAVPAGHRLLIVDCRYPFEYAGGHIRGAVNVPVVGLRARLQALLYPAAQPAPRTIVLVHCEFSQKRGPRVLEAVRELDREHNLAHYPRLDYDQLYLIHGGYVLFHALHPHLCVPDGAYVPMRHPRYAAHLAACRAQRSRERSRARHPAPLARRSVSDLPSSPISSAGSGGAPGAGVPLLRSSSGVIPCRLFFTDDSDTESSNGP